MKNKLIIGLLFLMTLFVFGCNDDEVIKVNKYSDWLESTISNEITTDIILPTKTNDNVYNIEWKSSNEDVLTNEGINRQPLENTKVTLEYKIYNEEEVYVEGKLEITVLGKNSLADIEAYIVETYDNIKINENIDLISEYSIAIIFWETNNEKVLTKDGVCKRQYSDTSVVMTYTIYYNDDILSGTVDIIVSGIDAQTKIQRVSSRLNAIMTGVNIVNSNIELVTKIDEFPDVEISWKSSNPDVLTNEGKNINEADTQKVTLTATISVDGETEIIEYSVEVRNLNSKKIFAYVSTWLFSGYQNNDLQNIDYVNLSFAGIKENGEGMYVVDMSSLESKINSMINFGNANTKAILSIGGWGANYFAEAVVSSQRREVFISSVMEVVKKYNLAGVDLDWEYPTSTAGGIITSNGEIDRQNYSLLCKELKTALLENDPNAILTAAVPGSVRYYEPLELNKYLDYLHLMTYDLDLGYSQTKHLSPLYSGAYSSSSAASNVNTWVNAGFDSSKIVVGCAFYVRQSKVASQTNNGLGQTHSSQVALSYEDFITQYLSGCEVFFDEQSYANYAYGDGYFYSYDSPLSIEEKVKYVKDNNLAGIMMWEYNQDASDSTLLNAMATIKK